ncbi:MAG: gfo/Idh/MocA family oxidoreductase, partial [Planctomycetaceae bacterium]|nr:gfo/Idh/MocA family oxidoreductase [Planctomycetaceae bacterium]
PVAIDGRATLPEHPGSDSFNVAKRFAADILYANGVELLIRDEGRDGILFEGDAGRIFVNRGGVYGQPVDDLAKNPLPRGEFTLYDADNLDRPERTGKLDAIINHMGNFYDCCHTRMQPLSTVLSQHQSVTTCHLANISMRLGRPLKWNPEAEEFEGDHDANTWLSREQRKGYEIA